MALQVMSLRPRFQVAAQQAQSEGASEDDIEAIKGMARLFAELGESYVGLLAQGVASLAAVDTACFMTLMTSAADKPTRVLHLQLLLISKLNLVCCC